MYWNLLADDSLSDDEHVSQESGVGCAALGCERGRALYAALSAAAARGVAVRILQDNSTAPPIAPFDELSALVEQFPDTVSKNERNFHKM